MSASLIRSRAMVTHAIDRHRWNEITDGAVLQKDGAIVEIGTYRDLSRKHPNVAVIGSGNDARQSIHFAAILERLHARGHPYPGARPRSSPGIRPSPKPGDPGRRDGLLLRHGGDRPAERRTPARYGDQRGAALLRESETAAGVDGVVPRPSGAGARDDLRPHRVRRAQPPLPAVCPACASGPHRDERAD